MTREFYNYACQEGQRSGKVLDLQLGGTRAGYQLSSPKFFFFLGGGGFFSISIWIPGYFKIGHDRILQLQKLSSRLKKIRDRPKNFKNLILQ